MPDLPLTSVDLNLLVALDALLAERSVTRAGARLSLTQPAMSHALARLRRLFGDELLVRSGREMAPTAFALTLREPVREALAAVERTLAARPAFDPAVDERVFRIYANDYLTLVLLAPLLRELAEEAPGVRLEVTSAFTSFAELLQDEGLDLLISPGELPGSESLPSVRLFADRFVLVGGPKAPLTGGRVSRAAFARMPYLVYRQGGATSFADREMDARGIERRVALTVGSFVLVPHLLAGSGLVTMLQERLLGALGPNDLQVARPPVALDPIVERAYWHPRSEADPSHRWLRERLVAAARALD